jgi:RNA polymerase sigma-70 factor (ECF subfamily)
MSEKDTHLIKKIIDGENNAFAFVYKNHYNRLYAFANSYLHDEFIACNIVQDAFMALWENRHKLNPDTNLPSYLLTIIKNNSLNHLNHLKTRLKAEENIQQHYLKQLEIKCLTLNACNPDQLFKTDVEEIISRTMESMPEKTREAIHLSRNLGLSNKDIAQKLGITVKGVEFHITKALKIFRENLSDYLSIFIFLTLNW